MSLPFANIPFINKRISFPIAPHIPGGLTTPEDLRRIADIAEKYHGTIKIAGNNITILGIPVADGEKALSELGLKPESFIAKSIRGVVLCAGKPHCPMARQDSTSVGLALDRHFFGQETPAKVRIGISGCPNCCAEVFVKDIGLFGTATGFTLIVGGNAGPNAQTGRIIAKDLPPDSILPTAEKILTYYKKHGREKERLGDFIARTGWDQFIAATIPSDYQ